MNNLLGSTKFLVPTRPAVRFRWLLSSSRVDEREEDCLDLPLDTRIVKNDDDDDGIDFCCCCCDCWNR